MKKLYLIPAVFFFQFAFFYSNAQLLNVHGNSDILPDSLRYLAQTPPGDIPEIFAPGVVSKSGRNEARITFPPDGRLAFFHIEYYPSPGTTFTMYSEYKNGIWTAPDSASFTKNRKTGEPFFALDGKRIYLNSTNAVNQVGSIDLSYVELNDSSWGNPISLGSPPNFKQDQYHICIVADTSIYFSASNGYICRCQYKNGAYQQRVVLAYPINYANTTQTWGDPYVAPDESYIIFKSTRTGGLGKNDIYISYKKADGLWTNPKNLGDKINSADDETSGDVTPDDKYMTFNRGGDLYWVSAGFIDRLKHTNFIPYLKTSIPNQTDTLGCPFNCQIPDSSFIDDDGNNTLTYTAALNDGNPLPGWLSFNPKTRTFSGTPSNAGVFTIKVTVVDTAMASAVCIFNITITNVTDIAGIKSQLPKKSMYIRTILTRLIRPQLLTINYQNSAR